MQQLSWLLSPDTQQFMNILWIVFFLLIIPSVWVIFKKAGYAGWKCLIPFYNTYIMLKIGRRSGWWLLPALIPIIGLGVMIYISIRLGRCFNKGLGFGFGLALLPFIFYPILAFGDSQYSPDC
jgi:hypothetical protein